MSKARDLANASTALSAVSATELAFLDGVTSAVQTQIDSKIAQATAINPTLVDAKGDIIAATAADTVARLAVGTNGQVLTADSTAATGLAYTTPAAGGMTVIASGSLSGSLVDITSIPGTSKNLQLVVKDFTFSTDATLIIRCNSITTGYWGNRLRNLGGIATLAVASTGQLGVAQDLITTNADNIEIVNIYDYASTDARKLADTQFFGLSASNDDMGFVTFQKIETTSAITSIQISSSAGTFSAGTYILYGVK